MVTTGVISPRTERYVDRLVLANAVPYNVFGKYGTNRVLPKKSSQTICSGVMKICLQRQPPLLKA